MESSYHLMLNAVLIWSKQESVPCCLFSLLPGLLIKLKSLIYPEINDKCVALSGEFSGQITHLSLHINVEEGYSEVHNRKPLGLSIVLLTTTSLDLK